MNFPEILPNCLQHFWASICLLILNIGQLWPMIWAILSTGGQVASFFGFVLTNFHKIQHLCLHTSWASMLNVRLDLGDLWGKILSIWSPGGRWTLSLFSFHKTPWNLSSRSTYMLAINVLRLIDFRAVLCQDMGHLICWGGQLVCFSVLYPLNSLIVSLYI
jgi:hypothetical protein